MKKLVLQHKQEKIKKKINLCLKVNWKSMEKYILMKNMMMPILYQNIVYLKMNPKDLLVKKLFSTIKILDNSKRKDCN